MGVNFHFPPPPLGLFGVGLASCTCAPPTKWCKFYFLILSFIPQRLKDKVSIILTFGLKDKMFTKERNNFELILGFSLFYRIMSEILKKAVLLDLKQQFRRKVDHDQLFYCLGKSSLS